MNGLPSREIANLRDAMRAVRTLYQLSPAREFGPLALKAVRQHMIALEKLSHKVDASEPDEISEGIEHNAHLLAEVAAEVQQFHQLSAKAAYMGEVAGSGVANLLADILRAFRIH